jgi:hypothetical protein
VAILQTGGATAALAVIGLSKISEFKVNGESFGDAVGVVDRKTADGFASLRHEAGFQFFCDCTGRGLFAVLDQETAQTLDDFEESFALLFHEHPA